MKKLQDTVFYLFYVQVYLAAILVLFALQATLTTAVPLDTEAADQLDPADAALAEEDLAEEEDALDEAELDAEDQAIEDRRARFGCSSTKPTRPTRHLSKNWQKQRKWRRNGIAKASRRHRRG